MTTGQRIREARKNAGLTQAELANKLGIPYQSIGQWERDLRKPKKETLEKIAEALNVDPLELSDNLFDEAFLSSLQNAFGLNKNFRTAFLNGDVALAILHNDNDKDLMYFYDMLNEHGQKEAVDCVFNLTEMPEYLKDRYTKTPEEFRKQRGAQETTDTTQPTDAPETPPEGE